MVTKIVRKAVLPIAENGKLAALFFDVFDKSRNLFSSAFLPSCQPLKLALNLIPIAD